MTDQHIYLWAQWGILTFEQYKIIKKQFGDLKTAWEEIDILFLQKLGFSLEKAERVLKIRKMIDFHQLADRISRLKVQILFIDDSDYPSNLRAIADPPVFLFVRGKLPPLHKSLGVVGTRKITDYGRLMTEKFVSDLVRNDFVVVSGLALGVDSCAHTITLKNNGLTIAVLGSGVDYIYPSTNINLSQRILNSGGAIISEYPLGTQPSKHHFPMRNRIISGLSKGVLIVEGGAKSGALITAKYALEQGREVFAIPNNITKVGLSGTNKIIRRSEAKLVENIDHILEDFDMEPANFKKPIFFSSLESELIERIADGGKSIDELVTETHYNVAKLSEIFINLQLKGVVREINRKWVII